MEAEIITARGFQFVVDRRETNEELAAHGSSNLAALFEKRGFTGIIFAHKQRGTNSYLLYQAKRGGYEIVYPRA